MIKLTSISNHIQCNISIFIITIKFHQLMPRCHCSVKFSLSRRDGDSNQFLPSWGIIYNTNPYFPRRVASGHLWYNSGTNFVGPISVAPSEILPICQEDQDTNPPLDLRHWLSAHPYYLQCAHFHLPGPSLN